MLLKRLIAVSAFSSFKLRAPHGAAYFSSAAPGHVGYAFDIDGVLLRGKNVLQAGKKAMNALFDTPSQKFRAPVVFLTNGGGHSEADRAGLLSELLSVPVREDQVILSHTPMQAHAGLIPSDRAVVTVGNAKSALVARSYGFQNVVHIDQVGQKDPIATPFAKYDDVPDLCDEVHRVTQLPVGVALVMSDSTDFYRDIQLLVDFVGEDADRRPEPLKIIYANPDKTFPNEHPRPRLAGGMLRVALDAILREHGGRTDYDAVQLGKPFAPNYELAERALLNQTGGGSGANASAVFSHIYMIGDNPPSDVRGARLRGRPWHSLLVRSGNFRAQGNDETDPADVVVDDAYVAVESTKNW